MISPYFLKTGHIKSVVKYSKTLLVQFIATRHFSSHQTLSDMGWHNVRHQGYNIFRRMLCLHICRCNFLG
jgi:hypothetical protein